MPDPMGGCNGDTSNSKCGACTDPPSITITCITCIIDTPNSHYINEQNYPKMSRGFAFAGVCLAAGCGVLICMIPFPTTANLSDTSIAYSTLRPELEKVRAERQGEYVAQHAEGDDKAISRAIMSDLTEARDQLKPTPTKGFAWGIREAIWGKPDEQSAAATTSVRVPIRSEQDMAKSPQESIERAKVVDGKG